MKRLFVCGLVSLVAVLSACNQDSVKDAAWTTSELQNVLDLSELGSLSVENEQLVLNGRVLPSELLSSMPHLTMGKDTNLLGFSQEALREMSNEAAYRLKHASPEQLREFMDAYGISMDTVRTAWANDQLIDVSEIRAAATELNARGLAVASGNAPAGTALLQDLGLDGE